MHLRARSPVCAEMFAILSQLAKQTQLAYGNETEKSSDAPGEEWLTNNEGNNQQNKLASLGVNVSNWAGE